MLLIRKFTNNSYAIFSLLIIILILVPGCSMRESRGDSSFNQNETWAEKLGFPAGSKVIIFHADDMAMAGEANEAVISLLENNYIQSAAAMAPCPEYDEAIQWAINNPNADVGLHLTLTSEWKSHRWGPVADRDEVPGLVDQEGYMWRSVQEVVTNATPEEVEKELRAQIEKTLAMGYRPDHMDTHMGTVYGSNDFTEVYLRLAEEYGIPAMVIDFSRPEIIEGYRQAGYPITDRLMEMLDEYSMPKLDYFTSVPEGASYDELKENFFELIRSLEPGLTEIIFHPQIESDFGKTITGTWQQRAWEARLFADPAVHQFFDQEKLIFTNWRELMERMEANR